VILAVHWLSFACRREIEEKAMQQTVVNGLNVGQLFDMVEAVKERPELGRFRFRASNMWLQAGHHRTWIKDFYGACQEDTSRAEAFELDSDEPPVLLGTNKAPCPVELVLYALAACLTSTLVYNAAAQGIQLEEIESTLEGDLDLQGLFELKDGVRPGYQNISVNFRVKSSAPLEQLQQLTALSPVLDIVSNPVPVRIQVQKMSLPASA
jgi:uncharacterized OsmC-like protein